MKDGTFELKESEIKELFPVGNHFWAKILGIMFENLRLRITFKNEYLSNHKNFIWKNGILEKYGLSEHNSFIIIKEEDFPHININSKQVVNRFIPRRINHP